jgi:dTDP-4-amino-4,6-dideoxygalactose transaminase
MDEIKFVNLPFQQEKYEKEIKKSLDNLLKKGDFILGQAVNEFEGKMAEYCQTKYALGVNSGTDALVLSMKALGIEKGEEIITVANSFIATAGAIVACGAKPVFVDVGKDYLIDTNKIERAITNKTKAIIPVHLTGRMADMDSISEIAEKYDLKIIEDSCQAIGAEYNGQKAGSLGDTGCFSLHPLKNLNVFGDGGVITTNNQEIYEKIKKSRNHGLKNRNEVDFFGYNSRLDTFQASIALKKLEDIEKVVEKRRKNAGLYSYATNLTNIELPADQRENGRDVYHLFVIQCDKRDELQAFLKENKIGSAIHYPIPIHLQKASQYLGYKKGDLPETEKQASRILSLPVHEDLTTHEVFRVINSINKFYS